MQKQASCSFWERSAIEASKDLNTSNCMPPPPSVIILSRLLPSPTNQTRERVRPVSLYSRTRSGDHVPWQLTPYNVQVHVLSFLSDADRCHASLACSSWRRAFKDPSLWRRRFFIFRSFDAFQNVDRYQKYLAQLGRHLQNMSVELGCPNFNTATATVIGKTFDMFLNCLNETPGLCLLKIRIVHANFHPGWHFVPTRRSLAIQSLCNLLKKQSFLRAVDLSYCLVDRTEGIRLLNALSYGNRLHPKEYLADINLNKFFSPGTKITSFNRYGKVMNQFQALKTVRMDQTSLSEAILERLTQASSQTLQYIELDCYAKEFPESDAVRSECWRHVSERFPALKVKININGLTGLQESTRALVRSMPLSDLRMAYLDVEEFDDPELLTGICSFILYLSDAFHTKLRKFHLLLPPYLDVPADTALAEDLAMIYDTAVVELVRSCMCLRELELNLALQNSTVELILDALKGQLTHLTSLSSTRKINFSFCVRGNTAVAGLDCCCRVHVYNMGEKLYCCYREQ